MERHNKGRRQNNPYGCLESTAGTGTRYWPSKNRKDAEEWFGIYR